MTVQVPVAGSYSSALAEAWSGPSCPAATNTIPLGSKVAVWNECPLFRLPVLLHIPLAGS